jgi:hypothetical protein
MPLHDWRNDRGFNGLHVIWQNQLLDWIQPRLPEGYRAYLGSFPVITLDSPPNGQPDLSVRNWQPGATPAGTTVADVSAPDAVGLAVFDLDPQTAVHIDLHGQLVAAIEIVSPRNKDRPEARERYLNRYAGYIRQAVHLLLIDILPRPVGFSFAEALEFNIGFPQGPCPTPFACSYRVGEPVPEGTIMEAWRRPLAVGAVLPTLPLPLTTTESVLIDLEHTYAEAARRVYLT